MYINSVETVYAKHYFDELPIPTHLKKGDVLLIVPPFHSVELAPFGVSLLQAVAQREGITTNMLFANMMFSAFIDPDRHHSLCWNEGASTFCEAIFANAAHGLEPFKNGLLNLDDQGQSGELRFTWKGRVLSPGDITDLGFDYKTINEVQNNITNWIDALAKLVASWSYRYIGVSCNFSQINTSIAILRRIKKYQPQVITLIGGSNCLGESAYGIAELAPDVDYIFAGDSEKDFVNLITGRLTYVDRIIPGSLQVQMDQLPIPNYDDYYEQGHLYIPGWENFLTDLYLPYETSRGCWWGLKNHCTFCGEYAVPFQYRQKSPERVVKDMEDIAAKYHCEKIFMVDSIMPHKYFQTLIPRLANNQRDYKIFYEQKANMTLEKVISLKKAGVVTIQPGIESFSSPLLALIKKGVKASQNIQLLRYATATGLELFYWLLWGFPGDKKQWYEDIISIIKLIPHLQAPDGLVQMILSRHSPYFREPHKFGITKMLPSEWYQYVFPTNVELAKFVNVFSGEFESEIINDTSLQMRLTSTINDWISVWKSDNEDTSKQYYRSYQQQRFQKKQLHVKKIYDKYILHDTRGLSGTIEEYILNRQQASLVLVGGTYTDQPDQRWAVDNKIAMVIDDRYVPLATAAPELLLEFESELMHIKTWSEEVC